MTAPRSKKFSAPPTLLDMYVAHLDRLATARLVMIGRKQGERWAYAMAGVKPYDMAKSAMIASLAALPAGFELGLRQLKKAVFWRAWANVQVIRRNWKYSKFAAADAVVQSTKRTLADQMLAAGHDINLK